MARQTIAPKPAKSVKAPKAPKAPKAQKAPKAKAAAHPAANPENVKKRVAARAELKALRARIGAMNTTQLTQFFGGFSGKNLDTIRKALGKVDADKKKDEISAAQKEIEKLQSKINTLKG